MDLNLGRGGDRDPDVDATGVAERHATAGHPTITGQLVSVPRPRWSPVWSGENLEVRETPHAHDYKGVDSAVLGGLHQPWNRCLPRHARLTNNDLPARRSHERTPPRVRRSRCIPALLRVAGLGWFSSNTDSAESSSSRWPEALNASRLLQLENILAETPFEARMERVRGIEPRSTGWKPVALPLSYTRESTQCSVRRKKSVGFGSCRMVVI